MNAVSFHDSIAKLWPEKYGKPSFRKRLAAFTSALQDGPVSGHWLDAGCGTGEIGSVCELMGASVTFLDASEQMLAICGKYHSDCRLGDVSSLPFGDASLDGIVCSSVIEYLPSPNTVIAEFARALKPDGRLIISAPFSLSPLRLTLRVVHALMGKPSWLNHSRNAYSRLGFKNILHHHGISISRIRRSSSLMVASTLKVA
ncbi:MAG TPA: class I SAM-dependent methyltransferase [Candidatus Angelobacter sp.]|nr:class I SAM-dependent methyltransferase [Candidatus Angelobacter sp.]